MAFPWGLVAGAVGAWLSGNKQAEAQEQASAAMLAYLRERDRLPQEAMEFGLPIFRQQLLSLLGELTQDDPLLRSQFEAGQADIQRIGRRGEAEALRRRGGARGAAFGDIWRGRLATGRALAGQKLAFGQAEATRRTGIRGAVLEASGGLFGAGAGALSPASLGAQATAGQFSGFAPWGAALQLGGAAAGEWEQQKLLDEMLEAYKQQIGSV